MLSILVSSYLKYVTIIMNVIIALNIERHVIITMVRMKLHAMYPSQIGESALKASLGRKTCVAPSNTEHQRLSLILWVIVTWVVHRNLGHC
jgi:hypothetical protein